MHRERALRVRFSFRNRCVTRSFLLSEPLEPRATMVVWLKIDVPREITEMLIVRAPTRRIQTPLSRAGLLATTPRNEEELTPRRIARDDNLSVSMTVRMTARKRRRRGSSSKLIKSSQSERKRCTGPTVAPDCRDKARSLKGETNVFGRIRDSSVSLFFFFFFAPWRRRRRRRRRIKFSFPS